MNTEQKKGGASQDGAGEGKQQQTGNPGNQQQAGDNEIADIQQSAQREGMGHHRHTNRGNEQALDAAADVDSLGSQASAAGKLRADEEGR